MTRRLAMVGIALAAHSFACTLVQIRLHGKDQRSTTALFRFEVGRQQMGFIDIRGRVTIPPKWQSPSREFVEDFIEGLAPAFQGYWGFIDQRGKFAIPPKYAGVTHFSEGLAAVELPEPRDSQRRTRGYIDRQGRLTIRLSGTFAELGEFSEGFAAVRPHREAERAPMGYLDRRGDWAIPPRFARGEPFHDGLAAVVFDGQCYAGATENHPDEIAPSVPLFSFCSLEPPPGLRRCEEGFIDRNGRVMQRFAAVRSYSEGLAAAQHSPSGRWGFVDREGVFRIDARYRAARSFRDGLAAAQDTDGGRWGYLDRLGNWTIPPRFEHVEDFSDGMALTSEGYVDRAGRLAIPAAIGLRYSPFAMGLAHIEFSNSEHGYIDRAGRVVFRYSCRHWPI